MREYNIITSPVTFLDIIELQQDEEINHHGRMILSGHITDEQEEEYIGILTGDVWETVQAVGMDGEVKTLFTGIVTDFSISMKNDQRKLTLELMTGSSLMDYKKHFRSYQNPVITYEKILKEIVTGYPDSAILFCRPYKDQSGEFILQYCETDWDFLKRLASREHQYLVADSRMKGVRVYYSMPQGEAFDIPADGKYTMQKDICEYKEKRYQGMTISEADCIEYRIQCREVHRIGDYTSLYGMRYYIYKMQSRYEAGELIHCCYLRREKGIEVLEICNKEIVGCTLPATVTKVKEDKVQVSIINDENIQQNINIWYPYATVYSTSDGTGWYCMPELGDRVRLIIPQQQERDAFVASSVHLETDSSDRKDPSYKVFKSKYQKEVRFTPDSIVITNNKGTRIELTDTEGIHIVSEHAVMLEAAEDLTISSDKGSLIVAGESFVNFKQKGTSIQLDNGISFIGGNLKIQ